MGISIVMTSGKGGTGKTTCTAAIAEALALMGKKVLAVDCDVGLKNLDLALGLTDRVLWDFGDVLSGRIGAKDAIIPHGEIEGLYFLSAPSGDMPDDIDPSAFSELMTSLKGDYDYVLFDSPAGLGSGFRLAAKGADMAIVVSTGDSSSLRDGQKTVAALSALSVGDIRLLVNRVAPKNYRRINETIDDVIDAVGARLIGVISEDPAVSLAANLEKPLMLFGAKNTEGQFYRVARRLTGERVFLARI